MHKQSNTVYHLSHLHFYPVFTACDWVQCKKNLMNRFKEKIKITDFWFIKYLFYHIVGIINFSYNPLFNACHHGDLRKSLMNRS